MQAPANVSRSPCLFLATLFCCTAKKSTVRNVATAAIGGTLLAGSTYCIAFKATIAGVVIPTAVPMIVAGLIVVSAVISMVKCCCAAKPKKDETHAVEESEEPLFEDEIEADKSPIIEAWDKLCVEMASIPLSKALTKDHIKSLSQTLASLTKILVESDNSQLSNLLYRNGIYGNDETANGAKLFRTQALELTAIINDPWNAQIPELDLHYSLYAQYCELMYKLGRKYYEEALNVEKTYGLNTGPNRDRCAALYCAAFDWMEIPGTGSIPENALITLLCVLLNPVSAFESASYDKRVQDLIEKAPNNKGNDTMNRAMKLYWQYQSRKAPQDRQTLRQECMAEADQNTKNEGNLDDIPVPESKQQDGEDAPPVLFND